MNEMASSALDRRKFTSVIAASSRQFDVGDHFSVSDCLGMQRLTLGVSRSVGLSGLQHNVRHPSASELSLPLVSASGSGLVLVLKISVSPPILKLSFSLAV